MKVLLEGGPYEGFKDYEPGEGDSNLWIDSHPKALYRRTGEIRETPRGQVRIFEYDGDQLGQHPADSF